MPIENQIVTKVENSHLTLQGEAGRGLSKMPLDFQAITKAKKRLAKLSASL